LSLISTPKEKLKPALKWVGGKRWLLPFIEPIWNTYQKRGYRFVEPFCGGLAVTLGLLPQKANLNDINPHLINFYNQLKVGMTSFIEMSYEENRYYKYRDRFNQLIKNGQWETPEAALLFYYLNHTCYNGLCRFNQKGLFNVPFGDYKNVTYATDFSSYEATLQGWDFSCKDFERLNIKRTDFIYADPPYDVEFRQYSSKGFTWDDQIRLAKWVRNLESPAVISNQATKRIIELYRSMKFRLEFVHAPRMISCKGDRTRAKEVIAIKE
jgi:DNA adenine methylase